MAKTPFETCRIGFIGCGNRGGGAAANAFDSPNGPVKMVAMADLYQNALDNSFKALMEKYADTPTTMEIEVKDGETKAVDLTLKPPAKAE